MLARLREQQALELRRWGATFRQIGETLGISEQAVERAVDRALRRMDLDSEPARLAVRKLEVDRLDRYLLALATKIKGGDTTAIDRALRIQERRATLLGLDAPKRTQSEHAGPGGDPLLVRLAGMPDEQLEHELARARRVSGLAEGEGDPLSAGPGEGDGKEGR